MSTPDYHQTIQKMAADYISCSVALNSRILDLSRRQLSEFPSPCEDVGNIECLYLEGNSLVDIPEHLLAHFKSLKYLDLRNNRLKRFPRAVAGLKALKTLLLSGNQLQVLPAELGSLPHLSSLSLTDNPLTSPPQHVVRQGTRAVLAYLRSRWQEEGEGDPDSAGDGRGRCSELQCIPPSKTQVVGTGSCTRKSPQRPPAQNRPPLGLPGPVLQQAPVHRQNPTTSTHRRRTYSLSPSTPSHTSPVQGRRRKRVSGGEGKGRGAARQPEVHVKVPSGSETQQAEIAAAIEKQKSQGYLESWRQEAQCMQRQMQGDADRRMRVVYTRAAEMAPFGTDLQSGRPPLSKSNPSNSSPAREQPMAVEGRSGPVTEWSSKGVPNGDVGKTSGWGGDHSPRAGTWGRPHHSDSEGDGWSPDAELANKRGHEYRLRAFLPTLSNSSPRRRGL